MALPPKDHPRYKSLLAREKLVEASDVVAKQGLIAHGRGEALIKAKNPVISVNGNVVALAAREVARLSEISGAKVEVNLFHRTPERISGLTKMMKKVGIDALGENADDKIPGLSSERAKCCSDGIGSADVVLVPLEDGDRCEALVKMGKKVITIDLNPLSRTAKTPHITIVDELTRCLHLLSDFVKEKKGLDSFDNKQCLSDVLNCMAERISS